MSHDRDVHHCSVCGLESWDNSGECYNGCKEKDISLKAKQIGGNHYEADYQHWDWAMDVRLGYFESAASKYTFRWYKKNGIEDLDKARSYLLKAKEGYLSGRWDNQCLHVDTWPIARDKAETMFASFADSAEVPMIEADLCLRIAQWRNDVDLSILIGIIGAHIDAVQCLTRTTRAFAPLTALTAPLAAKTGGSGQAGGTTTYPTPSGASVELAMKQFGACPCGCGRPRAKNQEFARPECDTINQSSPFGYDGDA